MGLGGRGRKALVRTLGPSWDAQQPLQEKPLNGRTVAVTQLDAGSPMAWQLASQRTILSQSTSYRQLGAIQAMQSSDFSRGSLLKCRARLPVADLTKRSPEILISS